MRRAVWIAAAMLLFMGTANVAQAQTIRFRADLTGSEETPAPGVLTGSFGTADVTLNLATQTITWSIDIFNMPSGTNNAHFHVGGKGLAGPTVVNIPFPANISNDYNLSGSASSASALRPDQGIRSWEDFIQALVGGQVYVNVHSVANAGGEVRGQLIRVP